MSYRVEKDVPVPMRDGHTLSTDLWIPDTHPAPTLLVRTPYGKDVPNLLANSLNTQALLEAGYAVVFQDCRGTSRSGGAFTPLVNEPADGADTVDWVSRQAWCDGTVGTFGASYLGMTQWATASQTPAALKAIAPTVTTTDYYTSPFYSDGGAFSLHLVMWWSTVVAFAGAPRSAAGVEALTEIGGLLADLDIPLASMPVGDQPVLDRFAPWWPQLVAHPVRDEYWQALSVGDHPEKVETPALHIGGWFDICVSSTARSFTAMRKTAGSEESRDGQRLIIGPWDHLSYTGVYHDRQFGLSADVAAADLTGAHIAFFDRWLRGRTDALDGSAPVRIFVMGLDQWRDEQDWPLPGTRYVDYFLGGGGHANTADGDGVLATGEPGADATDTFVYDPADPVPTLGGRLVMPSALNAVGPVDQRPVEARDDVLCFSTPVLEEPVEVTGHVSLELFVSSSAMDTDFTGKLVDVFPDGRAIYLTDGMLRARYRNSLARPEPLEPGAIHQVTLDLAVTSNVFLPGHRIRVEISSSNFPRYDRNTNTGGVIARESLDEAAVATNQVLHGRAYPSRLILPVIERGTS
ncbi:CocE/NonD family hydrolase [Amycolatopsis pithecellobii]|uniref:CocE/NonD family hydrolase n=1 Tax=Amycolatopsis pithecellobii TaxID=664692 RepID=A0A6N7YTJ2_9PSEU|nr:CocE/NonD family hydrolase [Amycolatopsis pithecellobii]MTD55252.1 CocE/NonD family hydrolase [Amycolatopsis pithecellobii]